MKITIPLIPRSKKNNQQLIRNQKTKKMMLIQSEQYLQYEKECSYFLSRYKTNIDYPINLKCIFYVKDNRRRDLANYLEAIQDILVKYKILKDDCWQIVQSVDGSRMIVDKGNERTEIEITKI